MSIEVRHLVKRFGPLTVCDHLNLDILRRAGGAAGPLGLGKTTLLRMIAGLEQPDEGSVLFHGEDATEVSVRERNVGFVFQHYALFGHMTVADNIAFGLRVRPRASRPSEATIREKVRSCCTWCSWTPWPAASRTSSPAASASAWPWPVRWRWSPRCCCWTSPSARWTPRCARSCAAGCAGCTTRCT
jgi:sulfate transport system ATP-binding protein